MRVYLAGKMDAEGGAWRDQILVTPRDRPAWVHYTDLDPADVYRLGLTELLEDIPAWPTDANTLVFGIHEYVGPYRRVVRIPKDRNRYGDGEHGEPETKYVGYFHGSIVAGMHGCPDDARNESIIRSAIGAIRRSDLVFAYLNTPDCFGTIAEIGIARGLGKFVAVVVDGDAEWDWSDYWFVSALGDYMVNVNHDGMGEDGRRPVDLRAVLSDAIVHWAARPEKPAPVAIAPHSESDRLLAFLREAANSFSQISQWSADPRVRQEAYRMFKRLAG